MPGKEGIISLTMPCLIARTLMPDGTVSVRKLQWIDSKLCVRLLVYVCLCGLSVFCMHYVMFVCIMCFVYLCVFVASLCFYVYVCLFAYVHICLFICVCLLFMLFVW